MDPHVFRALSPRSTPGGRVAWRTGGSLACGISWPVGRICALIGWLHSGPVPYVWTVKTASGATAVQIVAARVLA